MDGDRRVSYLLYALGHDEELLWSVAAVTSATGEDRVIVDYRCHKEMFRITLSVWSREAHQVIRDAFWVAIS